MKQHFAPALAAAIVFGIVTVAVAPSAVAQQKTAKQCTEEWRANKADNQAKGITEKAYVAQCRSGATAATQPATAPTAPAPAAPPSATRNTSGASPAGANQFSTEAQAQARCGGDSIVWVNSKSKIYHFSGTKSYGTTKQGAYMCERDAMAAGDHAAKNEKHP